MNIVLYLFPHWKYLVCCSVVNDVILLIKKCIMLIYFMFSVLLHK